LISENDSTLSTLRKKMMKNKELRLYVPSGNGYIGPVIVKDDDVLTIKRSGVHIHVDLNGRTTLTSAIPMNLSIVVDDEY
jgi:hypothetical protein